VRRARFPRFAVALVLISACGGGSKDAAPATSRFFETSTTESVATLGLTPIGDSTPVTSVLDTLPDLAETTLAGTLPGTLPGTSLDPTGLPAPVPPPLPGAYEDTNQIGQIEIPALRISEHFYEGVALQTLDNGPGHWPGSAMPGQIGNAVVAGHRVSHTHPFRDLDRLKPGDQVVFTTSQGRNVYVVDRTQIVTPDALWIVQQTRGKTATLFACHPKGSTSHRIVVFLRYAPELSQPTA
jgi:sortase A